MILLHAFVLVMFHIDLVSMLTIFPTMISFTTQYFIISTISTKIQDAYDEIRNALYCSKWYWMSINEQKTMRQIMMLAGEDKVLTVGIFGNANLERFTQVSNDKGFHGCQRWCFDGHGVSTWSLQNFYLTFRLLNSRTIFVWWFNFLWKNNYISFNFKKFLTISHKCTTLPYPQNNFQVQLSLLIWTKNIQ